jgi:hypothetical protein
MMGDLSSPNPVLSDDVRLVSVGPPQLMHVLSDDLRLGPTSPVIPNPVL